MAHNGWRKYADLLAVVGLALTNASGDTSLCRIQNDSSYHSLISAFS
jgi:hypothetical protein